MPSVPIAPVVGPSTILSNFFFQTFFIPSPTFTENELPDQTGRVHIVTGGYTGVGLELVKLLAYKNATVYLAGRSQSKFDQALATIANQCPNSTSKFEFLQLDLADLPSIPKSVENFLARESRLDVLTNNAGVMAPPAGSVTKQGHDLQMGTNCLGPYLFTRLLLPILKSTAKNYFPDTPGAVRITWAASIGIDLVAPWAGVEFEPRTSLNKQLSSSRVPDPQIFSRIEKTYGQSKACNVFLADHFHKQLWKSDRVLNVAWNPGNLRSELARHLPMFHKQAFWMFTHPVKLGGYTELTAGWEPTLVKAATESNHPYVVPWGRIGTYRKNLVRSMNDGTAGLFIKWLEQECAQYIIPASST